MNEEEVRRILGEVFKVNDDNSLTIGKEWVDWWPGQPDNLVSLDCENLTIEQLEALIWWMKNKGDR